MNPVILIRLISGLVLLLNGLAVNHLIKWMVDVFVAILTGGG